MSLMLALFSEMQEDGLQERCIRLDLLEIWEEETSGIERCFVRMFVFIGRNARSIWVKRTSNECKFFNAFFFLLN